MLYNTSSLIHLINNRALFTSYKAYKASEARPIIIAFSKIYPKGIGTAKFSMLIKTNPPTYRDLILTNAEHLLSINTNIISSIKYYALGGTLLR